jgi:hypothetical protein
LRRKTFQGDDWPGIDVTTAASMIGAGAAAHAYPHQQQVALDSFVDGGAASGGAP